LGDRKDIRHIKTCSIDPRGSVLEEVKEEDSRGNRLTQVYLEKQPLNGSGFSTLHDITGNAAEADWLSR